MSLSADVVIIGSGAGGATTALTLAEAGMDVLVLEEGGRPAPGEYGGTPTQAMSRMYRRRGMTPILGRVPIAYVEGCCLGGSTEINSGFWHRASPETLLRWQAQFDVAGASMAELTPHYEWAEALLGVTKFQQPWPASTNAFARGIEAMGWSYMEVARAAPGCKNTNACAQGCPTGAKQGMTSRVLPMAEALGARILTNCRAELVLRRGGRVEAVIARIGHPGGIDQLIRIDAKQVIVCCGPTETPALLQRSGVRFHVGDTLRIHPYLKAVAEFPDEIDAEHSVKPLLQIKEFWPEVSMGGAYFTRGHLAVMLSESARDMNAELAAHRRMAGYYVSVKGTGLGSVRPGFTGRDHTTIRYQLSAEDRINLSRGFGRLASVLIAAGATRVIPSVHGVPDITTELGAIRWLDDLLPKAGLALQTVHAFSSVPMGERRDRCAVDSYGAVFGVAGLFVNDASMLPDSPGVNPQGTIMALARRNALNLAGARTRP